MASGCGLFHHGPTPQQQFLDALKRGNGAEANQMWLKMDAQDRADFSHSRGIAPEVSPGEVQAQLLRHQKADDDSDTSAGAETGAGDIDRQTTEMPGLNLDPNAGSLQNLPKLMGPDGGASSVPAAKQN